VCDLKAERVGVVELHDPAPRPVAVGARPGVAVDHGHLVTPARQSSASEQASRTHADDGYPHDDHLIR
jgi:hypothetical protein